MAPDNISLPFDANRFLHNIPAVHNVFKQTTRFIIELFTIYVSAPLLTFSSPPPQLLTPMSLSSLMLLWTITSFSNVSVDMLALRGRHTLGQSRISSIACPKSKILRGFPCQQNKTCLSQGKIIFSRKFKSYSIKQV